MSEGFSQLRPTVSIILPVLNEAKFIRETVTSLLNQALPDFDLEVLVVDAKSTDGSRQILSEMAKADGRVRIFVNENIKTPFAFNIGLREAKGEYVCILGAHSTYQRDYVSVCLNELIAQHAAGCSGRVITRPASNTLQARLVAWALAHRFGSSGKSFRTQHEGFVDTIPYPVMRKQALIEVGGYDEGMFRNQDNDMNQKLQAKGHKLYCTWKTQCFYHPPGSIKKLFKYAFHNGFWNAISIKENFASMGLRHVVPFAFLAALVASLIVGIAGLLSPKLGNGWLVIPFPVLLGLHLSLGLVAGIQICAREKSAWALLLPLLFFAFHLSYGFGTAWGFLTNAKKPGTVSGVRVQGAEQV